MTIDMDIYMSDPSYEGISNLVHRLLTMWDPFSWNKENENIPYPSKLYTLNPNEFLQACMMHLGSYGEGSETIITFCDLLNEINFTFFDENNDENYQSYTCLLCATGTRAFYEGTLDLSNALTALIAFFVNATNIMCDGLSACYYSTFRLYQSLGIDIYCRGRNSCNYALFENVQSLYCFGSDACTRANFTNVVCSMLFVVCCLLFVVCCLLL